MIKKLEDVVMKVTGCHSMDANLIVIFIVIWGLGRFIFGVVNANDDKYCRVKSIGDVLIAPAYTLGCNVGKDRFDIRVN